MFVIIKTVIVQFNWYIQSNCIVTAKQLLKTPLQLKKAFVERG